MPPENRTRLAERMGVALAALPLIVILALLLAGKTGAQEGLSDMIVSENVEYLGNFPEASDGVGARVVGNRLFVTTTKDLIVYDVSDPPNPERLGSINANISFENEEVPTNGKVLGVSGQIGGCNPVGGPPVPPDLIPTDCLVIYDVSNPEAPVVASVVGSAGDHTHTCVLDCKYFFGSSGTVVDATDPYDAKLLMHPGPDGERVDWQADLPDLEADHHQNEIRPGVLITATQPVFVISINERDGGSPFKPAILARYRHEPGPREDPPWYSSLGPGPPVRRFIHGARWPNAGADKFVLLGGETNFQTRCHDRVGKFMVMDTTRPSPQGSWTQTDEVWPQNGNYTDASGRGQTQILGCSAHWFEEHPTFKNGGLVALAEYEQGTRFMQVTPDGLIRQLGFALPIGGSVSAPHWGPDGRTVYNIDYTRGMDVLRYEGPFVVPDDQGNVERPEQAVAPGEQPLPETGAGNLQGAGNANATPPCAATAGFSRISARGNRISVVKRQQKPFSVELFRHSKGRRVVDRRVARLRVGSRSSLVLPKRAKPGFYFARIRMVLPGTDDVRRVALRRQRGRWSVRPDHYMRTACGALKAFKLERTVFGGRNRVPLRIAYRLPTGVDRVTIEILRGTKVVRRIRGATQRAQAHRYRVPASIARPGRDVRVRLIVERSGRRVAETLTSRRL
jgi:hypothetical protein